MPRPAIGKPLPRVVDAYSEEVKWRTWILAERGHGDEWQRVFRVSDEDWKAVFAAIKQSVVDAPVSTIRPRRKHGVVCGVDLVITINERTARIRTSWHYERHDAAPRLVSAWPTP